MTHSIRPEAHHTGCVTHPHIGLLIMGRKRPGFDPEWGAAVTGRVREAIDALPWPATVPEHTITDEATLREAVATCRSAGVTVPVVVQPTISDGRMAPLLARLWDEPLLLWATPEKPTGRMISANSLVGTHVMAATLRHLERPLEFVYGEPADASTMRDLRRSIQAIHGAQSIRRRIVGLIGSHAPGFVDFHADPVFLDAALESELFHLSTVELIQRLRSYTADDVRGERDAFAELNLAWSDDARELGFPGHRGNAAGTEARSKADDALTMQARYYRAFREIIAEYRLDTVAFRCWPDLPSETGHWPYLALARLVSEGFPIAMEGDVDGALCGRIVESMGIGPVYLSDWLEHTADTIAIWHTGAAPFQLCAAPGEPGAPELSVQFNNHLPTVVQATIRGGMDATLFRIWRLRGRYHATVLEGRTAVPQRDLMATNGVFTVSEESGVNVYRWFERQVQRGMPHHVCVVRGHHGDLLRRATRLMGAEVG